ncbi:MAG: hypothetical protein JNL97_08725, partial [Verrucomicrobiales bacterium]|nr:hypothetical protein [Verrucomicrobiales bacterium]
MLIHASSLRVFRDCTQWFLWSLLLLESARFAGGQVVEHIRPNGGQLLLEWVNEQPGFLFEQTEVLGDGADWRPLPLYPVVEPSGALSVAIDPDRLQRFFRLREDVLPTAVRRSPVRLGSERISWDFTYRLAQLEYSEDAGSTWLPLAASPSIDFETGEFYLEQPVASAVRQYRLRINRPPSPGGPVTQTVAIGEQWAFSFPTRDQDGDLIRYTVAGLPAGAHFDPTTATLTFKPEPGSAGSHVVRLTALDGSAVVTKELTLTVPPAPARATTALSGVVLDAHAGAGGQRVPIVGVIVTLLNTGARTVTDAQGAFAFEDVPGGLQVLNFDPTEAAAGPDGAVYAGFREEYTLLPKIGNRISRPVYLPRLAGESLKEVVTTRTTIVENSAIGVRLTIPPNTAMAGGTRPFTNALSISEVPRGFEPGAMPSSLQPDLLITIQPVGVTFSQPVAITFPNRSGYEVGTDVEIWSLDAGTGQFVVVGVGRVSTDGQRIETISGGVRATDWHFVAPAPPNGGAAADSEGGSNKCPAGSEFTLNNGEMTTAFESPGWFSHGEQQRLRFVYSSRQAYPGITVPVELTMPARVPTPKSVAVSAQLPGTGAVLPPVWLSGADMRGGDARRTTVHVPAADLPTGVHTVSVETVTRWALNLGSASDARRGGFFDVETAVVNRMH